MGDGRVFLGFEQPAVRRTSELLVERYAQGRLVSLTDATVVVPGGRAGRRLREHLLAVCDERELGLLPPQIVTVSHLPELLYQPRRPFASIPLQQMMWGQALRQLDAKLRRQILPGAPEDAATTDWSETQWIKYGAVLWAQYRHLSAEGLSFADVFKIGSTLAEFPETGRWEALASLQRAYLADLDRLHLWDKQTARLVAVRHDECHTEGELFLLGTSDIGKTLREMLVQVREKVTPLVHAPPEWVAMFDELGCLRVDHWCEHPIELADEQWSVVQRPSDQAWQLARELDKLNDCVRYDQVRIGCADEQLVPYVRRVMNELDVPCRWGPGRAVRTSGPYQLLACLRNWLDDDRFENLIRLARHPQINTWMNERGVRSDWIRRLDRLQEQCLPSDVSQLSRSTDEYRGAKDALDVLNELRDRFVGQRRQLSQWTRPILDTLGQIYGARPRLRNDVDSRFDYAVCDKIQNAVIDVTTVPDGVARLSAAEVFDLVLRQLDAEAVAAEPAANTVELLGWLELALDDAAHLFVCGLNEGCVPRSVTSDEFLPNRIRQHLKIDDDRRRYARDAYALSVMLASKQTIHLVTAKCDADGNPLKPSRLLFATSPEQVARRWQKVLAANESIAADRLSDIEDYDFGFHVPPVRPIEPVEGMPERISVTAFKSFLTCPYRFYLAHRLRLRQTEQDVQEMDARLYGTIVHEVLATFGNSEHRGLGDAAEIEGVLNQMLDELVRTRLGPQPLASVEVQIAQMRQRMRYVATAQSQLVREGWQIAHAEQPHSRREDEASMLWTVDGKQVEIVGRIDRIDYRAEDELYRVLDYKTFDTKKKPEKTHRDNGEWIDLQLPLYRHLARQYGVEGQPELGYFIVGRHQDATGVCLAEWDEATLETADEKAREVTARILAGDYGEPVEPPPQYDDWAYICLADVPRS